MAQTSIQKIPIFSAPDKQLDVPASGAEALARGGARLGQIGQEEQRLDTQGSEAIARGIEQVGRGGEELGNSVQQTDNQTDLVNVNNVHADLVGSLQQAHDQFFANANPTDTNAADDFREQVLEPAVEQLKDAAQTKIGIQHANDLADTLEMHFGNMADQTQARRIGQSWGSTLDSQAQSLTAAVQQNPANLPLSLASFDNQVRNLSSSDPNLNPDAVANARQKYRQHMVATAGQAMIDQAIQSGQTPNLSQFTSTYAKDLGDDGVQALSDYQAAMIKAKSVDDVSAAQAKQQQFNINSAATAAQHFDNWTRVVDGQAPVSDNFVSKVIADPTMADTDKGAVINAYRRLTSGGPKPTTNPLAMDGLLTGLASPTDRPTPAGIMQQVAAGRLSYDDARWAINQAQQPPSPGLQQLNQNLATARASLVADPGSGTVNPAGMAAYQRFQFYAVNAYKSGDPIDAKQLPNIVETFQPTGQDALSHVPVLPDRPSLNDIFGGR
jgi:hypothetical protein